MIVDHWHDMPCGCSWSERGWWIITFRCRNPHHLEMVPDHVSPWHRRHGGHYGPVRDPLTRRGGDA